jgi:Histidine kinase
LLNLRDEEHRKFARELHDSVGQLLAAMSMNQARALAEKGLNPVVEKAVSDNAKLVAQASQEIRTISHLTASSSAGRGWPSFGHSGELHPLAFRHVAGWRNGSSWPDGSTIRYRLEHRMGMDKTYLMIIPDPDTNIPRFAKLRNRSHTLSEPIRRHASLSSAKSEKAPYYSSD